MTQSSASSLQTLLIRLKILFGTLLTTVSAAMYATCFIPKPTASRVRVVGSSSVD